MFALPLASFPAIRVGNRPGRTKDQHGSNEGRRGAGPRIFDIDELVRRVADREELTPSEAFNHVRAVPSVLAEAVTGHELEDVRATLPDELATLFQPPAAVNWPDAHVHRPHR